ncbi:MAG: PEGA domain-containing protein [Bacillota bacterium]
MNKKIRDLLFILFIVVFVVTTVLVSFHAAGYTLKKTWPPRFDRLIEKTGMLILDSEPQGAVIYLNGERQRRSWLIDIGRNDITTPTKIKNLEPGEYTLRLEKDGYWPLEKKVRIESGQASFAEDMILFKRSTPSSLALCAPQELSFPETKKNFLILPKDGTAINLKTETTSRLQGSADTVQWSKSGSQAFFGGKLFSLNGGTPSFDLGTLGQGAVDFFWDESSNRVYYRSDNTIGCFLTDNNTASTVLSGGDYVSYAVNENSIYTVEQEEGKSFLRVYDTSTSLRQSSSEIPSGNYAFRRQEGRLDLYDRRQHSLYILADYPSQPIVRQIKPVVAWKWLDASYLLWHNGYEINTLDLKTGRQELLIRVSDEITGMDWNRTKNYLVYSSANKIQVVNLNLEQKLPITVLEAEQISGLAIDEKEEILYFYAKIDGQAGVFKQQLH